jgi:uncharacterized protein YdiU (UPF0061 family)
MIPKTAMDSPEAGWRFDNTYARLPQQFYTRTNPTPVRLPAMAVFNRSLAKAMGLRAEALESQDCVAVFAGNAIPQGAEPIAQAYAGHQFGHFNMLGDGRAILLGEHLGPDGSRWDIQLKGPGRTAYSRRGDGRAALGPMFREYLISEAMHALGIPTTRSLAVVTTGETVFREEELPGAVLTRIAASHIRVGTFEYAAMQQNPAALRALADYTIQRHYPEIAIAPNSAISLLDAVIERQASLVAKWLLVGFIHGVMNTDNMALSGETIDYGPCAFMDTYDPATVFSSIDRNGRYAYANQPGIAHWNLARLAEALLPLFDPDENKAVEMAKESLGKFPDCFQHHWLSGMRAKLGLFNEEAGDVALVESLLQGMLRNRSDYTNTLRALDPEKVCGIDADWHAAWRARLASQPQTLEEARRLMRRHNPVVIPRNHRVEEALEAATSSGDYQPFHRLLAALANPFEDGLEKEGYREASPDGSAGYQTFCGT